MEKKVKFIIIGLIGFSIALFFLFIQAASQQQSLLKENNDLKIENTSLVNMASKLENDLKENQGKLGSLKAERDRGITELNELQKKFELAGNDREQLQDNLKTIRAQNDVLLQQLKSLAGRKEALDKKVQNLQEVKSTVQKRLNEMEAMLTDRISKIASLRNELDVIKSGQAEDAGKVAKESVELPAIVVRSTLATVKEKAQIQVFPGKILAVNLDSNFVIIDLGSSAGANVGKVFNVYRQASQIGSISVIQARANISACDIKRMSTPLRIGDSIK